MLACECGCNHFVYSMLGDARLKCIDCNLEYDKNGNIIYTEV